MGRKRKEKRTENSWFLNQAKLSESLSARQRVGLLGAVSTVVFTQNCDLPRTKMFPVPAPAPAPQTPPPTQAPAFVATGAITEMNPDNSPKRHSIFYETSEDLRDAVVLQVRNSVVVMQSEILIV